MSLYGSSKFNISVVGDSKVGKSCLLNKFVSPKLIKESFTSNINMYSQTKYVKINDRMLRLQFWEYDSKDYFSEDLLNNFSLKKFCRKAQGVILVYDVGNRDSFNKLKACLAKADDSPNFEVVKILVGNKCELKIRKIEYEEGLSFSRENNFRFFETSTVNNYGVEDMFTYLANELFNVYNHTFSSGAITLSNNNLKGKCCQCLYV